jgi:hypothetical protein
MRLLVLLAVAVTFLALVLFMRALFVRPYLQQLRKWQNLGGNLHALLHSAPVVYQPPMPPAWAAVRQTPRRDLSASLLLSSNPARSVWPSP